MLSPHTFIPHLVHSAVASYARLSISSLWTQIILSLWVDDVANVNNSCASPVRRMCIDGEPALSNVNPFVHSSFTKASPPSTQQKVSTTSFTTTSFSPFNAFSQQLILPSPFTLCHNFPSTSSFTFVTSPFVLHLHFLTLVLAYRRYSRKNQGTRGSFSSLACRKRRRRIVEVLEST